MEGIHIFVHLVDYVGRYHQYWLSCGLTLWGLSCPACIMEPVGLRKSYVIGSDESSDLRAELIEKVSPSAPVVGAKDLGFLLVHFKIPGEDGLPGEDPSPAPVPPFPYGGACIVTDGWEGLGSGKWPGSSSSSRGWLDLKGHGREAFAKAWWSFMWFSLISCSCMRHWERWFGTRRNNAAGNGKEAPLLTDGAHDVCLCTQRKTKGKQTQPNPTPQTSIAIAIANC